MKDNDIVSEPFNRRDFITDDDKLTKLGGILMVMLCTFAVKKAIDMFYERLNSN